MGIETSPASGHPPLTHTQTRVWFLHRFDPTGIAYHAAAVWLIDGPLDVRALEAALDAVVARQPMLRTRFPVVEGVPRQVCDGPARMAFERAALPAGVDLATLDTAVREFAQRPFALAGAAPIRWALFQIASGRHALVRVWHHILGDALSGRAMNADLARAYAAARAGGDATLPALDVDFAEYARRLAADLAGPGARLRLEASCARLAGSSTLAIPTDFRRPASQSFRGAMDASPLAADASARLRALGKDAGASSLVAHLAAYAVLLARLSGETDIVVGTPVGSRPAPEFDPVVGFFADTVACRIDLGGAVDAREAIRRTAGSLRAAIADAPVPFDRLVDALGLPRDPSRNPLFQAAFGVTPDEVGALALAGCVARRRDVDLGVARFDLTLQLQRGRDGAVARWEYATDLYAPGTIARIAAQYRMLVDAMARTPERPVFSLPMMDASTRASMLACARGVGGVRGDAPTSLTIPEAFAATAELTPSAPAIGGLDYASLDAASGRLAEELRSHGVGRRAFVAVARADPVARTIAWLAVLRTGAAYLPIDPDLPASRIEWQLDVASAGCLIADAEFASRATYPGLVVVCPERDALRIGRRAPAPSCADTDPGDPALVVFTSGTTGKPKGVVIPQAAVVRLVRGTDYVRIGPGDVVAALAHPAFDASTFEIWGALLNGARIAPIAPGVAVQPRVFAAAIARERVSTLFVTTAIFEAVARDAPDAFAGCRTVLFGGETADPARVRDVLDRGPPARLVHVYGPTETTTFATWHEVRGVPAAASSVPIGRAIAGADVHVLREDGEPTAPGEPGEIVVGGAGVALGYLGAGTNEQARFHDRSVAGGQSGRCYRTGDRGRRDDDGAIEFLGRTDTQVKLRGHRVELEEVEGAIAAAPGVREAAAIVCGATSDTRRIVAFAVASDPAVPPPDGLGRGLRRVLPAPMLPSRIVWLASLPLSTGGKVDRRALAALAEESDTRPGVRVPPRDPLEAGLLELWKATLGRQDLGVLDGFFDHGGHSLSAARLVDDLERASGIRLPLPTLFLDDTVAGVARAIRDGEFRALRDVAPLNERGRRPALVYAHGDFMTGGFHSYALASALGPDQPVYIVHPHGVADGAIPTSIETMVSDRLRALRAFRPHGPYVVGGHCNGAFIAFEMAARLIAAGESVPALVVIDSSAPGAIPDLGQDGARRKLAQLGFSEGTDRTGDLAHRLYAAMAAYRARRLDTHLVFVRSADSAAAAHDGRWAGLARSFELVVLPGDHASLVMEGGGRDFARVIRTVVDRALSVGTG